MRGLAGRRFLVCGGGSGIGEATAERLAAEDAVVIIADRHADAAARVVAKLPKPAESFQYEQSDPDSVAELFASVTARGPLNGVAVVAGVHPGYIPLTDITVNTFLQVHGVNTLGALLVLQQAVNSLAADGHSSAVVVSSVAGIRPVAKDAVYASSKAAVQAIVRSAALEYAGRGVRVNSVLPGGVITPLAVGQEMVDAIAGGAVKPPSPSIPLGYAADASELASAIAFLLSDESSHITATEFIVDGGLFAGHP